MVGGISGEGYVKRCLVGLPQDKWYVLLGSNTRFFLNFIRQNRSGMI
jgi:hypothetical protein